MCVTGAALEVSEKGCARSVLEERKDAESSFYGLVSLTYCRLDQSNVKAGLSRG